MTAPHITLDMRDMRRLIVAGDVHGHLKRLITALKAIDYDASAGDRLVLLGDLLDRGPDVLAVHEWLNDDPTVVNLLGNHDEMLLASLGLRPMDAWNNPDNLDHNGGDWLIDFAIGFAENERNGMLVHRLKRWARTHGGVPPFIDGRIVEFARRLATSPIAATVLTPGGRRIGLIHADVPRSTWAGTVADLDSTDAKLAQRTRISATWDRTRFDLMVEAAAAGKDLETLDIGIPDVDHVFLGHSIVPEAMTAANLTWIDTGPYRGGPITALDVDAWMDAL